MEWTLKGHMDQHILAVLGLMAVVCITTSTAQSGCSNPIPGVTLMFQGVDITKLDMFPADSSKSSVGFKHNVVDYSCDLGERRTLNGETYQVPDQVSPLNIR